MVKRPKKPPAGVPGWVVTFADLMSLLLTFFILILSFADVSDPKFKKAMGSVKEALGVRKEFIYESQLSSNNPLKDRVTLETMMDEDYKVQDQILSARANTFCELEQDRRVKEAEYIKQVFSAVAEKIQQAPGVSELLKVVIESTHLNVVLNEDKIFKGQTASLAQPGRRAIEFLLKVLPEESLDISVTHHLRIDEPTSRASVSRWMRANNRSLSLVRTVYQIPTAQKHHVSVKSQPMRKPASGSSQGMELHIKWKDAS